MGKQILDTSEEMERLIPSGEGAGAADPSEGFTDEDDRSVWDNVPLREDDGSRRNRAGGRPANRR